MLVLSLLVIGLVTGGAVVGFCIGILGGLAQSIPFSVRVALLAGLGVAATLRDFRVFELPFPQATRQVPRSIFGKGREVAAFQFGFELGTGVRTYATASAPHLAAAMVVLFSPHLSLALLAGASFGAGRGIMPIVRSSSNDVDVWDDRIARTEKALIGLAGITAIFLSALLVAPQL